MLLSEIRTRYPNIAWISSFGFLPRNGSPWVYQLSGCCQSWHQASGCTCWRCSEEGQEAAWMEKAMDIRPTCVNVGSYASELIKIQGYSSLRIHFLCYSLYVSISAADPIEDFTARACVNLMWCWLYSFSLTQGNVTELAPMSLGLVALGRGLLAFHRGFCAASHPLLVHFMIVNLWSFKFKPSKSAGLLESSRDVKW